MRELAYALDPVLWAVEELDFTPDPWQAEVLRSPSSRILLNCSRQSGKSTASAVMSLHKATFSPGSLVLIVSPTLRQSSELFRNVTRLFNRLGNKIPSKAESALRLELENGSRIVSLPGKESNIRGYPKVALLVIDEASWVPDELYFAVRPMLAVSSGRLAALSTPHGTRGWWYEAWRSKEPWDRYEVPADKCPRISAEFLAEEKRVLGEYWYRQEYFCEFIDLETQVFRREDIDRMFDKKVEAWSL